MFIKTCIRQEEEKRYEYELEKMELVPSFSFRNGE